MFEFKLPDLGEGVHEGQIVGVLIQEGDTVSEFQPLLGPDCTVADVLGAGFDRAVPDGMAKQADLEDLRRRHAKLLGELTGKETR